jgi:spore coat polysaccharide biosynthesis protein SpsF (cytidylyltransferase family)
MLAGIVIQARMGSSRFPGKSLADLDGQPVLHQLLVRLERAEEIGVPIVATSSRSADDAIEDYCASQHVPCFRGSEDDVLGRYTEVASSLGLDVVIRACGDAPLTDPEGIRAVWSAFEDGDFLLVHNRHPEGWPAGTAVDLITRGALIEADKCARLPEEREHVVPYLLAHSGRFPTCAVSAPPSLRRPHYHLAIDYPDDLDRMRRIYRHFGTPGGPESLGDVIAFLDEHPEVGCPKASGGTA